LCWAACDPDPVNTYVAGRFGQPGINLLPASVFRDAGLPRATQTVGARTEHLALTRGGAGLPAMVTRIEHLGDQSHLHLDLAGQGLVTLADPDSELQAGDRVGVILKSALLFDADGERMGA